MRDAKAFAAHGIEIATLELIRRREGNRVHEDIEAIPPRRDASEESIDLRVVADVER